jgi:hypothetical protein
MEPNAVTKLDELEKKIDTMYASVEKLRKIYMWTMYITVALFVLPLIGLAFALPSFMTNYVGSLQGITN